MFIHIITDHNSVVSNTQITDNLQLCQGEDLAQGVVGVVQDDSFGPAGEAIGQGFLVKSPVTGAVSILTRWLEVLCYNYVCIIIITIRGMKTGVPPAILTMGS